MINSPDYSFLPDEQQELTDKFDSVPDAERNLAKLEIEVRNANLPHLDQFPLDYQNDQLILAKNFEILFDEISRVIKTQNPSLKSPGEFELAVNKTLYTPYYIEEYKMSNCYGSILSTQEDVLAYSQKVKRINSIFFGRYNHHRYAASAKKLLDEAIINISSILKESQDNEHLYQELICGEHFVSHGVAYYGIGSVFESGVIASSQSQIDRFGKRIVTTASPDGFTVVESKDKIEILPRDGRPYPYGGQDANLNKRLQIERDEILLDTDRLYGNIGTAYFIFPAGYMLQDSPFYLHDGIHLFAHDYSPGSKKGKEIALNRTPHFVIIRQRDVTFIHGLINKAPWIVDKEAYERDSLMIIEEENLYKNRDNVSQRIKERCKQQFKNVIIDHLGRFIIPTGQYLDKDQAKFEKKVPLFTRV